MGPGVGEEVLAKGKGGREIMGRLVDSLLGAVEGLEGTADEEIDEEPDEEVVVAEEAAVDVAEPEAPARV